MGESNVKLLGWWASPFVLRARLALRLKSVSYEFIEENLLEPARSELLLKLNPLYKKIPVLIHDGKPIIESQAIVQYIDEVWPHAPSILPSDARQRADARIWISYIDDKLVPALIVRLVAETEDAKRAATAELEETVAMLERALRKLSKGKDFFGGDNIGYLDIAFGPFFLWIEVIDKFNEVKLLSEAKTPSLLRWAHKSFFSHAAVKDLLPDIEKLAEYALKFRPILIARFANK
ncbi:GLUTATHIONE S-TRANSFERASE 30B, GLUTATHIONE S-TRANSFERASE 30, GLUTATHIONE S-TRANSFERASE TAU 17 [Hibiscus trionum]|uniref:Glutathione S-transferase n=1 Tax=Hibiscus trionum TaxID=183268 RepID=A0A9W7HC17_HIBTR|nr:GLUTATHIONE S-TRANSFERASE 30B, GLUTATHIONE S-TRANSFERASE 30, GLUTATHIONE S-TRANSFERASE TAU 17 [Hibiscus trionum]